MLAVVPDPDHELRLAALARARQLNELYTDFVPVQALRLGFDFGGQRASFGSFQRGIHRSSLMSGSAALTLTTAPPVPGKPAPYEDLIDPEGGAFIYHYRSRELVQAAHITSDSWEEGIAAVVNGLALCAIHHLAYDRNILGIDPGGVVHLARRIRDEQDGPMLSAGLQGFHGKTITLPRSAEQRPDPGRLEKRFAAFEQHAA